MTPLRLATVSDGNGNTASYYLANSPLVGQIGFANNGAVRMTTTKQYDYLNRLTGISSSSSSSFSPSFNYQYNQANQRTQVTNTDNSYWVYQYDDLGQVISGNKHWANGTPVAGQQFTYNFDDIGNRKSTASGGDASGAGLRPASYHANALNQYTSRDVPGYADVLGSANPNATVTVNLQRAVRQGSYFWDELSENNGSSSLYLSLTNLAVLNNGTNADIMATNVGDVFLPQTPETFGYDNDGNMTNSGRWTITWDAENRALSFASLSSAPLASQKKVDCAYDYQGRRIQKIVSTNNGAAWVPVCTNRYVYDGWNLIAILNPQSSILQSFAWGTDLSGSQQGAGGVGGLLSITVYAGEYAGTYFYGFDGNGNVAGLVNAANGILAAQYEYGPFGEVIRQTGPMAKVNPMRFSTKYQDDESDLLYYGYRYYKPSTGSWLSRDPLGEIGFDPIASNIKSLHASSVEQFFRQISYRPLRLKGNNPNLDKIFEEADNKQLGDGNDHNPYVFVKNDSVDAFDPLGLIIYAPSTCTIEQRSKKGWCKYVCVCPAGFNMDGMSTIWKPCSMTPPAPMCYKRTCSDYVVDACAVTIVVGVVILSDGTAVPVLACAAL